MQKVFMRFNSIPAGEFEKAIKWFSDTFLKEYRDTPSNELTSYVLENCTAVRTAPDRDSSRYKWWWTDEEMLAKLKGFEEVFYDSIGEL